MAEEAGLVVGNDDDDDMNGVEEEEEEEEEEARNVRRHCGLMFPRQHVEKANGWNGPFRWLLLRLNASN